MSAGEQLLEQNILRPQTLYVGVYFQCYKIVHLLKIVMEIYLTWSTSLQTDDSPFSVLFCYSNILFMNFFLSSFIMWLYGQYSYIYLQFFLKISHSGPYSDLSYITGIEIGFETNIVINIYTRIYSQKLFFIFHISESSYWIMSE